MLESLDNTEVLLANGNWMKGADSKDNYPYLLDSPDLQKILEDHKELNKLELQFGEMILHVIEQIEKESDGLSNDKELWPEVSMLDMKKYLKADVSVPNVSESSPIFVLESVYGKLGQTFHNFNIFELYQLAACTRGELSNIVEQAPKSIPASDFELAVQDAKKVIDILIEQEHKTKAKEQNPLNAWNSWGSLSQVSNLLQIKENGQKIANFMGVLAPKHITASFFGSQPREDEDIDSFEKI